MKDAARQGKGAPREGREFFEVKIQKTVRRVLQDAWKEFAQTGHLPDHPVFEFMGGGDAVKDLLELSRSASKDEEQERIGVFFSEIIRLARQETKDPRQRERLGHFFGMWHDEAFSETQDNPMYGLNLDQAFVFGLGSSSVPELQSNFAADAATVFMEKLNSHGDAEEGVEKMEELFQALSIEDKLNAVQYCITLYANGIMNAEDEQEEAVEAIRSFLQRRSKDGGESPFVHYAAAHANDVLFGPSAQKNFSVLSRHTEDSVWTTRAAGRLEEREGKRLRRGSIGIWKHIKPDEASYVEPLARVIARDAIGTFDQASTMQSFARVSWEGIRQNTEPQAVHFAALMSDEAGIQKQAPLLREMQRPAIRQSIEQDMGISLAQLSLREQIQLLSYLSGVDYRRAERGFGAIRSFGLDAARAFLSCEYGKHFGEAIMEIAERLDRPEAGAVFKKYAEIVDLTEGVTDKALGDIFLTDRGKRIDRNRLNEELLTRAKDIIATFAARLREKTATASSEDVIAGLERFEKDTVLFASMFKTMAKGKEIDFSELRGVSFKRVLPGDIDEHERTQMMDILDENWRGQKPEAVDVVRKGFETKLDPTNPRTHFYLLKKRDRLLAFMRFDDRPDLEPGAMYAGSLNVSPELRGSALGETVLKKTVEEIAREHPIYADFFPEIAAGSMYVEEMQFTVTGVERVDLGDGKYAKKLIMMRDDRMKDRYRARAMSVTELSRLADNHGRDGVRVIRISFPGESARLADEVGRATSLGMVMTRYFSDPENKKIRYAVFEPAPVVSLRRAA